MNEYLEQARVRGSHEDQAERLRDFEEHERRLASELAAADYRGPDWKLARRVKRSNMPRPDRLWRERVLERDQVCVVHTDPVECGEGFQAHHVVPQQELRRTMPEALWHPLSGVCVCGLAHRQHHSRVRPIMLDDIPLPVLDYLSGVGFGPYIERHYPASGETLRDAKP